MLVRIHKSQQNTNENSEKVQGPNSENAAEVKRCQMHPPESFLFSQQQLCNKVCAQQEEQINAKAAGPRYAGDQCREGYISSRIIIGLVWQGMENEYREESEEAQAIQFRVIKAVPWLCCAALDCAYARLGHWIQ
jgi:hypothetical protein